MVWQPSRIACPNLGHPVLTLPSTKYRFLQVKNSLATISNELPVLKLFQFSKSDLLFSLHAFSIYKVRKPCMTKFGQYVRS